MSPDRNLTFASIVKSADWSGSAADLAEKASEVLGEGPSGEVNERLVRDYVSRRILKKPEREGRGATFGYHQLLQLIAARLLLKGERWPLLKITEFVGLAGRDETLRIIQQQIGTNDAVAMSQSLARESHLPLPARSPAVRSLASVRPAAVGLTYTADAVASIGWREEFLRVCRSLGAQSDDFRISEVTRVAIAPGLRMEIENARLRRMTEEDARAIGRAVEMALIETAVPRGGKK